MVAATKFDLLPAPATPRRVEQWVRLRLRQAGLPRPEAVFAVSAETGLGVKELVQRARAAMGFRGDMWVVGAQNGEDYRGVVVVVVVAAAVEDGRRAREGRAAG